MASAGIAHAQLQLIGTYYRADRDFPEYYRFWHEDANDEQEQADPANAARKDVLGASVHVFVKNTGTQPATVTDALLAGISLKDSLAFSDQRKTGKRFASIYFAGLPKERLQRLIDAGEPVWWKVDPVQIAPGGCGEVIVRLRQAPKGQSLLLTLVTGAGRIDAEVPVRPTAPRVAGISFGPDLTEVFLYFRHPTRGQAPARVFMDGVDVTGSCTIRSDSRLNLTPVVLRLAEPLEKASFHAFSAAYDDGSTAAAGTRVFCDEFRYGMFGGMPGKAEQPEIGRRYIDDLVSHNLNLQMAQIGSPAIQKYFLSAAGKQHMDRHGFKVVLSDPGKFGITDPYALYVHDEPDCGDYKVNNLPEDKKIGSMARYCIERGYAFREAAPDVPQILNLDMTYKPRNWQTYGQIPDFFTVDPYYQARQRAAWQKHPERIELYKKATYVLAVGEVANSAGEPKPLHVILYANRHIQKESGEVFRYPTPPEKRIEVYYAIAAGAKELSYWWYTPTQPAYGVGAASLDKPDPQAQALWREIGLLGAELRTAGPILRTSCPIELPIEASENVWVRCLARGHDTLLVLAVNDQYTNTDKGTDITPVRNASVTVPLPRWMQRPQAFEITPAGTKTLTVRTSRSGLALPLGTLDVTRMIVITTDAKLRAKLQGYYAAKLQANTTKLMKEP